MAEKYTIEVLLNYVELLSKIEHKIQTIERSESWEGGEPDLGTIRIMGEIKQISRGAQEFLIKIQGEK